MTTKPIISWPGGKTRLLKHIVPHIPAGSGYIEAFAGGCAVLLAKDRSKLEVVNDVNSDLVTLYRVAKQHPDALVSELLLMPCSRQYLTESLQLMKTGALTDLQRAALFIHANKTSFCASGTSFAVAKSPESSPFANRAALFDRIHMFALRMAQVAIENMDYRRLLQTYDHPGNLFFLDPPYLGADVSNYRGWTEIEMGHFQAAVLSLAGRWIVTVDDSPFNRSLWKGHDIHFVVSRNGVGNQAKAPGRTFGEMVIYSPGLRSAAAIRKAA
jgi:DNA adenine methylase